MGAVGTVAAKQAVRRGPGRQTPNDQRHQPCAQVGGPLGRCTGLLRTAADIVQSLCSPRGEGRVGPRARSCCRGGRPADGGSARQHDGQGASLDRRREKGEQSRAIGRPRDGRTTKTHALTVGNGRPMRFALTGGLSADCGIGEEMLARLPAAALVHADNGHDTSRRWRPDHPADGQPDLEKLSLTIPLPQVQRD